MILCHECRTQMHEDDSYAVEGQGTYDFCQPCANRLNQQVSEEPTMTDATQNTDLLSLLQNVSQYPLQNVLQRTMQSMVSEIARGQHLSDRIELGDEAVSDARGKRPGPDQSDYTPQFSEKQVEIIQRCAEDEAALIDCLGELADFYRAQFGEQPQYGLMEQNGTWSPITDFSKAVDHEYNRAHQGWLKRQGNAPAESDKVAAAQHLTQAARAKAAKAASRL